VTAVTASERPRRYIAFIKMVQSRAKRAATMTTIINPAAACERDNQTDELTEVELSKVIGGTFGYFHYATPSIPIPPPGPQGLQHVA
jgi:hypothetical protein